MKVELYAAIDIYVFSFQRLIQIYFQKVPMESSFYVAI